MYLLDTVVLSELRKKHRDPHVVSWIGAANPADLFLSVVTIGEIELGIERQRTIDPSFADQLAAWLDMTLRVYGERILPIDVPIVRRWGRLAARIGNKGLDIAIAATALEHGFTVVTRNLSDFAPTGVELLDPFAKRPRRDPS
ncbi:MAG TPA: type II toxin-antitoxin system VapC family toxin [Alphaproteobacteria bacterium]